MTQGFSGGNLGGRPIRGPLSRSSTQLRARWHTQTFLPAGSRQHANGPGGGRLDIRSERRRVRSASRQDVIVGRTAIGTRLDTLTTGRLTPIVAPHSQEGSVDFIGRPVEGVNIDPHHA